MANESGVGVIATTFDSILAWWHMCIW